MTVLVSCRCPCANADGVSNGVGSIPRTGSQDKSRERQMPGPVSLEKKLDKVQVSGGKFGFGTAELKGNGDVIAAQDASSDTISGGRGFVVNSCGTRRFECMRCGKTYAGFVSLRFHMMLEHPCEAPSDQDQADCSRIDGGHGVDDQDVVVDEMCLWADPNEAYVFAIRDDVPNLILSGDGCGPKADLLDGNAIIEGAGQDAMISSGELLSQLQAQHDLQYNLQRQRHLLSQHQQQHMQEVEGPGEFLVDEEAAWRRTLEQTRLWESVAGSVEAVCTEREDSVEGEDEECGHKNEEPGHGQHSHQTQSRMFVCSSCGKAYAGQTALDFHLRLACSSSGGSAGARSDNGACFTRTIHPEAERDQGASFDSSTDLGSLSVVCHGAEFGNPQHAATRAQGVGADTDQRNRLQATSAREGDLLEVTDVLEDDILPGQIGAPPPPRHGAGAGARSSSYSRARVDLSIVNGGGTCTGSNRDPQRVVGSRFGEGGGEGGRVPRRGVQFADVESPRGRPKKRVGIVGGEINYDIILSEKEKSALKARTLSDQVQTALTEMRCVSPRAWEAANVKPVDARANC